jgi:quaternary ammonium compound-resistance protein SugE
MAAARRYGSPLATLLPLGSAYAARTGIGAVGSFIVGAALLGEPLGAWRILSALLVVAGVIGLRLTSAK